jgi:LysR family transcriptional regulator, regulator for metE and metH
MFLEIRHLRTIRAVAESDSLALAAEQLHLTQSALSHQIRAIEDYYGLTLFSRRSRPMQPTPSGRRFLQAATQVLPLMDELDRDLRQIAGGDTGRLFIALECHSCFSWLLPTLNAYREQWPNIDTDLSLSHSFEALDALKRGLVDVVVSSDPVDDPEISFVPLFHYDVVLTLSPQHPLVAERVITPQMLATQTIITYPVNRHRLDIFSRFLTPAGVEPAATRSSELTVMIAQWVASHRGVAALPAWAVADELMQGSIVARPLGEEGMHATLYLAFRRQERELVYVAAFIEAARAAALKTLKDIRLASSSS